jgi:hypothetical protein
MVKWNPDVGIGNAEFPAFIPTSSPVPTMIVASNKEAKSHDEEGEGGEPGNWSSHIDV